MQRTEETSKLGIVIPTLDQTDLLLQLLNSLETRHPHRLFLINNRLLGLSVAASWNRGITAAFEWGADMALVLNDDVVLHPKTVDNMVACMREHPCGLVCGYDVRWEQRELDRLLDYPLPEPPAYQGVQDFCCFLLPRRTWQQVGPFDENFTKAYYEDIDYEYRVKEQGLMIYRTLTAPCYHYGSRTGARYVSTPERQRNREYFRRKWGKTPD